MTLKDTIQDLFQKYSVALEVEDKPEETPAEMQMKKLENGTEVYTEEEFSEGASVFVMNEEGEKIPLPDGDYEMEDGGKIQVEDGKVKEISAEEEKEEEEVKEEEMSEETAPPFVTAKQVASMIQEAMGVVEQQLSAVVKEKEEELKTLKEELSATKKAAAEPVARAAKTQVVEQVDLSSLSVAQRINHIHGKFS